MWESLGVAITSAVRKIWDRYKMRIPFLPDRWKVEWVLKKYRQQIRDAIWEDDDVSFLRRIQHLYPILKKQGINMPSERALFGTDDFRSYHRKLLRELEFQITKLEDNHTPLNVEKWNGYITRREKYRKRSS